MSRVLRVPTHPCPACQLQGLSGSISGAGYPGGGGDPSIARMPPLAPRGWGLACLLPAVAFTPVQNVRGPGFLSWNANTVHAGVCLRLAVSLGDLRGHGDKEDVKLRLLL